MNENRHAAGAKQAGVSMGGKFAATEKTPASGAGLLDAEASALPTLTDEQIALIEDGERPEGILDLIEPHIAALPSWEKELAYVSYDDQLRPDQIDTYLSGDVDAELCDEIDDVFYEQTCEASERIAADILEKLGVEDPQMNNDELVRDISDLVREHDMSDPVSELAGNTHPQLMRVPISPEDFGESPQKQEWLKSNPDGYTSGELYSSDEERSSAAREQYVIDYLRRAGVDVDHLSENDRQSIANLVSEGPYYWHEGVRLDAIWYGSIEDAAVNRDGSPRTFRLGGAPVMSRENPEGRTSLVLLDTVNGSGYEASFDTPFTVTVTPDRPAMLDSGGSASGYGWDDTAGVVKSAYEVDVNQVEVEQPLDTEPAAHAAETDR